MSDQHIHYENLSATLQSSKLFASQAQSITRETVVILEKLRDDDYFLLFWKEILTEPKQLDIDEPILGGKRKASRRTKIDIVALQSVSFMKNWKILPSKFYLMDWIYLLMQSKTGLSERITSAKSY